MVVSPKPDLEEALRACGLHEPVRRMQALSGGCINSVFRVEIDSGSVLLKINADGPSDLFARESEGLEALAQASHSLRIPHVHGHGSFSDGQALAMEFLEPEPGGASPATWERLGRGLAELHRPGPGSFGFRHHNYLGLTPQDNTESEDWGRFFAERRIGFLVEKLMESGTLSDSRRSEYDPLIKKIPQLLSHRPKPSLLHGDLWNGNFLASSEGPALIDPAVYYGDREAEWAMMFLFGGFPDRVFAAYQEAFVLPEDWKQRQPLYQLYHVLNHQLLFGGSYGEQAHALARRYF